MLTPSGRPADQSWCSSGTTFRSAGQSERSVFQVSARPTPQPRPVRSVPIVPLGPGAGPAQPPLPGHRGRCRRAPSFGWKPGRSDRTPLLPNPGPWSLPQPGSRSWVQVCTNFHWPIPSLARVAPAPTCVPHTWRPKQTVQLGSQEQQRQPVGSKVGWDKAAGTPPPDLGQGSGPPPFLPGFGGRSPETKFLETGATSSSRNQAWVLELLEISSWSLELRWIIETAPRPPLSASATRPLRNKVWADSECLPL